MDFRTRVLVIAVAATAVLLALVVLAPYMAPYGSFRHLDGNAGLIDGGYGGHGFASLIYGLGDIFCHQEEARSFMLNGSQLPFCVRDVGILAGLPAGFLLDIALGKRLRSRAYAYLGVVLVLVMVAEWVVETQGFDDQSLRFVSGVCAGVGFTVFLGWMFHRDRFYDIGRSGDKSQAWS